ncbi:SH3 domain-containing protein [Tropicimonas isoalkanivorans]|uniref:SH3 domain-containing protein n=1 Tax=Tropicimonas isoalkanivorans TaxID=441112 RepID=A0A1I1N0L4_9RHOB|nr:hypothetical protein [Tropicimonas isoalkanivorans]SFC91149.1 hypothetical protein SAMN04488094_11170 [Tropicimonas isoalkanivorans]
MLFSIKRALFATLVLLMPSLAFAQMGGHGPDAWQVTGVAADDTLNVRTGPGTDHLVIGEFAHDATGLRMVTCVPFLNRQQHYELTEDQKAQLPPRWCLMKSSDRRVEGWVSANFLREDTSGSQPETDPLIAEAVDMVRRVYELELSARSESAIGPLHPSVARSFFFSDVVERLRQGNIGADPLFGTQDRDITDLEVFPAPERAMFRGLLTVHATFRNFGHPQRAIFRLRIDGTLEDPEVRIMRIEHDGWALRHVTTQK